MTGKLLETTTIYPLQPRNDWQGSLAVLVRLVVQLASNSSRSAMGPAAGRLTSWPLRSSNSLGIRSRNKK